MNKRYIITIENDVVSVEMFDKSGEEWESRDFTRDDFLDFIKKNREVRDFLREHRPGH